MRDGVDFARETARFSTTDVAYVVDVLRGAYTIVNSTNGAGDEYTMLLGDFIAALDECDSIEIVEDED